MVIIYMTDIKCYPVENDRARNDATYREFMWWWLHHTERKDRIAAMFGSYYDESAVDGGGPISAVGGLLLDHRQYSELSIEWGRTLDRKRFPKPFIHMKDFGQHGELASFPENERRALFTDLAWIINDNKQASIGSTLTPEDDRRFFGFLKEQGHENLSIHANCFLQAAVIQAKWAEQMEYSHGIPFMLDGGCPNRADVDLAHSYLCGREKRKPDFPSRAGGLTWENDERFPSLQAADVIAWTVRRRASESPFNNGLEPLLEIVEKNHMPSHFEPEWMEGIANALRAKLEA